MTPSDGEKQYAQGVGHFEDFWKKYSLLSWVQALSSLQAAVRSLDLDQNKEADANYKLGVLLMFDSDLRSAEYHFKMCLQVLTAVE